MSEKARENNKGSSHGDTTPNHPFIELKNITKYYGETIKALDNVDFWIHPREIVGLVGDNGAGKSTLIKILSGVLQPTQGTISVNGTQLKFATSRAAMDIGIETIYQDMNLIDSMNIMRNIFCGREETKKYGFLKMREMEERAMELLEKEVTIEGIRT